MLLVAPNHSVAKLAACNRSRVVGVLPQDDQHRLRADVRVLGRADAVREDHGG